ncbi:MAG: FAD-binding protein, partial [Clostridia bacterium]|nr:FAD-binding protein [Clostridia bacterium]
MVMPSSEEQVGALVGFCKKGEIRLFTLGKGSNVLASDEGFDGAIMLLGSDFARISRDGDRIFAQAGASMASVCKFAAEQGLTGLEFAYGIPGTVGGGAVMNAGAYGGEFALVVESVRFVDENGKVNDFTADRLDYGYRHSVFSGKPWVVTGVTFRLTPGQTAEI